MSQSCAVSHLTLIRARAGCSAQVHAHLKQLIEPTLQVPGCLNFVLHPCDSDPLLWHVSGQWADACAMQAYFNSPLMDVFSTLLNQQVVCSLDFQTFDEQSSSQLRKRAS